MKQGVRDLLVALVVLGASFALGLAVARILTAITGNYQASTLIGTAVWLFGCMTLLCYAYALIPRKKHTSALKPQLGMRVAIMFAVLGATFVQIALGSVLLTAVAAVGAGGCGWIIGRDAERRWQRRSGRDDGKPPED